MSDNPDIIVSTPYKLIQLLRSNCINLNDVKSVVVDEADLIFTFGHYSEMHELKTYLHPKNTQVWELYFI